MFIVNCNNICYQYKTITNLDLNTNCILEQIGTNLIFSVHVKTNRYLDFVSGQVLDPVKELFKKLLPIIILC